MGRVITHSQMYDFWRGSTEHAQFYKIIILSKDDITVLSR